MGFNSAFKGLSVRRTGHVQNKELERILCNGFRAKILYGLLTVIVYYGVRKGQYHTIKMYGEVELQLHAFFFSAVNQGKSSASPPPPCCIQEPGWGYLQ